MGLASHLIWESSQMGRVLKFQAVKYVKFLDNPINQDLKPSHLEDALVLSLGKL